MVTRKVSEPVQEALKAYLELALGLGEASKKKAEKTVKKVAQELVGKSGATASQLQTMAEDLVNTSLANREAVSRLVRAEMERAMAAVGLATSDEIATLTARVEALERQVRDARANSEEAATLVAEPKAAEPKAAEPKAAAAPKAAPPVKKAVAKKAVVAKKAPAKSTVEDVPVAAKKAPVKRVAKKAQP